MEVTRKEVSIPFISPLSLAETDMTVTKRALMMEPPTWRTVFMRAVPWEINFDSTEFTAQVCSG